MAATNFTPISLYYSSTAAAVPAPGNLVAGELALNTLDEKLYFKNLAGTVKLLASNAGSSGSVTSVGWTGGIVSVATATTTPALTVAGTSGGVPYFSSGTTWASSAALAASALVIGGGAGAAPSTTTTGTGVVTALGVNTGTAGAFVVNGGALGSPSTAGTMPAFTLGGTVSGGGNQINHVVIGNSSPLAGAFTTVTASGNANVTGFITAGNNSGIGKIESYVNSASVAAITARQDGVGPIQTWNVAGGVEKMSLSAAGALAVTGTLSATGAITGTAGFGAITASATTGQTCFLATSTGGYLVAGTNNSAGAGLLTGTAAYAGVLATLNSTNLVFGVNSAIVGTFSSTALALGVGVSLTGGTSGTGYSFSGSAPAGSLTLTSGGQLGIGASPNSSLTVATSNVAFASGIGNVFVYTTDAVAADIGGTIALGGYYLGTSQVQWAGLKGGKNNATSNDYGGYLSFNTRENGSALSEVGRFDSSGNLGVGATTPSTYGKLVVSGGGFTQLATTALPATSGSTRSDFTRILDSAGSRALDSSISSTGAWIQSRDKNDYSVNYDLFLQPNGGNLLVGTTTSATKLTVSGATTSSGGTTSKTTTVTTTFITIGTSLGPTGAGVAVVSGYQTSSGNQGVFLVSFCQNATTVISSTDNTATTPSFQCVGNALQMKTTTNTLAITCCLLF